jgi:Transposase DDE domain
MMGLLNHPQARRPIVKQPIVCPSRSQVDSFLRQFAQAPGLPFADVLDERLIEQTIDRLGLDYRHSLYTPAVTLALFVGQAVDPDPSLRQAVVRLLAQRQEQGLPLCSADTGGYAKARQRLPEELLAELTRTVGQRVMRDAPSRWLWRGRPVKVVDGSTVSMPDTPANQQIYPQPNCQRPGVGFPLLRLVVLFSLSAGTVLDCAFGPYQGKETGETALFRTLHARLQRGDILLADRYYCSYFEIALLQEMGVDVVMRLHHLRSADFRRGQRLGHGDRLVIWPKPKRPAWMDEATYQRMPEQLQVRLSRHRVPDQNVRCSVINVVSTLLDSGAVPKAAITGLYRLRWQSETDLNALKTVLHMDVLRGKTPALVHKELWAHLLAYNLIRKVMCQAAREHGLQPRQLSFKAAVQTLQAFAAQLRGSRPEELAALCRVLWRALIRHRVGARPGRLEPRRKKRRPKPYPLLSEPRARARKREVART